MISEPCKEVILTGKENTQAQIDITWVKEEWAKASGPDKENQHPPIIGPQDSHLTLGKTPGAELGFTYNGPKFMLGLASPKEIKIKTLKKPKGGDQKKNKENIGPIASSLPNARDRNNIILEIPRSNHKE